MLSVKMKNMVWGVMLLNALAMFFFCTPRSDPGAESAIRMIVASLAILWVPGFLWNQLWYRAEEDLFSSIGYSFFRSATLAVLLIIVTLGLSLNMRVWCSVLLCFNFFMAAMILIDSERERKPFVVKEIDLSLFAVITVLAIAMYRWADQTSEIKHEVALHLTYSRIYADLEVLNFASAVLRPGELAPPNLFFLWEFLLAAVAKASGLDVLVVFLRSRWLVPVLGYASLYVMARSMFRNSHRAHQVLAITLLANISAFSFLPPNLFWDFDINNPYRKLSAFFGSIHHSDTAMEILMPLQIAMLFNAIWSGGRRRIQCFAIGLMLGFFWHPREYFQVVWYAACLLPALLLGWLLWGKTCSSRLMNLFKCYMSIPLMTAFFYFFPKFISTENQERSSELARMARDWEGLRGELGDWWTWIEHESFFRFCFHFFSSPGVEQPLATYTWLLLPVLFAAFVFARRRFFDNFNLLVFLMIWWLSASYMLPQKLLLTFTYSEILVSKVRFMSIFGVVMLPVGWFALMEWCSSRFERFKNYRFAALVIGCAMMGWGFDVLWVKNESRQQLLEYGLWTALVSAVLIMMFQRKVDFNVRDEASSLSIARGSLLFLIFIAPVCFSHTTPFMKRLFGYEREISKYHSDESVYPVSKETLSFLSSQSQARARIAVPPDGHSMLSVYAGVVVRPLLGNVIKDRPEVDLSRTDSHPLFNTKVEAGEVNFDRVSAYCEKYRIQFIWVRREYLPGYRQLVESHAERFRRVYESPVDMMVMVVR